MSQKTLKQVNDEVFDFLLDRHYQAKEQGKPESFLFVMTTDEERLKKGFWLPGNQEGVRVSFLTRSGREAALFIYITVEGKTSIRFQRASGLLVVDTDYEGIGERLNLPDQIGPFLSRSYSSTDYVTNLADYIVNERESAETFVATYNRNRTDFFELGSRIELKQFYEQFQRVQQYRMAADYSMYVRTDPVFCSLHSLHVRNFRGIRELTIDKLPNDIRWLFLTGENGFGKTSVLQAIAVGLWGLPYRIDEEFDPVTIECVYSSIAEPVYNDSSYQRYTFSFMRRMEHLAAYGSSRLQTSRIASLPSDNPKLSTLYHLFNNDGELLDVEQWLIEWNKYRESQFEQIVKILKVLIPTLNRIEIHYPNVVYFEQDEDGIPYEKGVSFGQLAAGFRSIIALICDMLRRLWDEDRAYEDIIMSDEGMQFLSLAGIVIIDEFELHLHPKYQRELPKKLSQLFPNVQFLASTHSPIPLLGAPKETVVLTVHRTEEEGITVERMDVDFSKLLPNAILTSPIFGFEDIIPESAASIADVQTEDNYDEAVANERLKKKLKILKAKLNTD